MICLRIHGLARWAYLHKVPVLPFVLKTVNRLVFSVVLPPESNISPRCSMGYEGLGTVVHRDSVIEDGVIVGPRVTLGGRSGKQGAPHVERGVMIGSGAALLGPIRIGEYAQIGSNAVVITDIPAYAVAVGVPAKVVRIETPETVTRYT